MIITKGYTLDTLNAPFVLEDIELCEPGPNEVLVEIKTVGICHTDASARNGIIPFPMPGVLGHEGAGIVVRCGSAVTDFSVGDQIAMSYGYCGKCLPCIKGKPYACEQMVPINFGGAALDGTKRIFRKGKPLSSFFAQSSFAYHAVAHENSLVKIPSEFPLKLAGPLGCGIQTGAGIVLNHLKPEVGESIVVFGCGAVGMSAIMASRIAGCINIIAVGGNPDSLKLALELGATHTINRKETEDIPEEIRNITGSGADYCIDTSGNEQMVMNALHSLHYTGKLVTAGPTLLTLNTGSDLGAKSIIGVTEGNSNPKVFIPQLIEYYLQGRFPIDRIMKFYDFNDLDMAFEDSIKGKTIKAVLVR